MAIIYPKKDSIEDFKEEFFLSSSDIPVNMDKILLRNNITLVEESDMDKNMSGYIEKRASGWFVGINQYDSSERKRFTKAHEFAHYILHRSKLSDKKHEDFILLRSNENNPMEQEANEFAAELLMPKDKIKELIDQGVVKYKDLAQRFGVSIMAIKYRAYKLGYTSDV